MPADGARVLHFAELDSTNAEALRQAAAGDPGDLWILADRQSEGRGRQRRSWVSHRDNLLASYLLRPDCTLETALQLSLVAGLVAYDTAAEVLRNTETQPALALKWPNDLLLDDAKLAGVLLESVSPPTGGDFAIVIGTGLNVGWAPDGAAALADHGAHMPVREVFDLMVDKTIVWLEVWRAGMGFEKICSAWQERAIELGRSLSVNLDGRIVEGHYGGIDSKGALRLLLPTGETRITTGDVFLA